MPDRVCCSVLLRSANLRLRVTVPASRKKQNEGIEQRENQGQEHVQSTINRTFQLHETLEGRCVLFWVRDEDLFCPRSSVFLRVGFRVREVICG